MAVGIERQSLPATFIAQGNLARFCGSHSEQCGIAVEMRASKASESKTPDARIKLVKANSKIATAFNAEKRLKRCAFNK